LTHHKNWDPDRFDVVLRFDREALQDHWQFRQQFRGSWKATARSHSNGTHAGESYPLSAIDRHTRQIVVHNLPMIAEHDVVAACFHKLINEATSVGHFDE
jgi:hypothetical protein